MKFTPPVELEAVLKAFAPANGEALIFALDDITRLRRVGPERRAAPSWWKNARSRSKNASSIPERFGKR
jgi:hypothetical protein